MVARSVQAWHELGIRRGGGIIVAGLSRLDIPESYQAGTDLVTNLSYAILLTNREHVHLNLDLNRFKRIEVLNYAD